MTLFTPNDWYWLILDGSVIYSSAAGAVVADTNGTYLDWLSQGNAATEMPTAADLDARLAEWGLPQTGLNFTTLAAALIAASTTAAQALISQAYTDQIHSAAGALAATIVTVNNGAPASGTPDFTAFNAYASSYGLSPAAFATLVQQLKRSLLTVSAAFGALEAQAAAATTKDQLLAALTTFQGVLTAVVAAMNAASPPKPVVAPPPIVVPGINA